MSQQPTSPPHLDTALPLLTARGGQLWIPGDIITTSHGTVQSGPMYVQWIAPETITHPEPLVFVHGGGAQGSDWLGTVDERPGWAIEAVRAGRAVYVVDRPGHGRSPFHPEVIGPMGGAPGYEMAAGLFFTSATEQEHTAWPWPTEPGGDEADQLVAAFGPLPADLALSQTLDADRLARLLDRIGPAVLVTHSAGGPVGWLTAQARPALVRAIAAIEPMGPPFAELPGLGTLSWGLTAAPIAYDPPRASPAQAAEASPSELRIPGLRGLPVLVLTGGASPFSTFRHAMAEALSAAGADVTLVHLPDRGIDGNGHALMLEANSSSTLGPVLDWTAGLGGIA